MNTKRFGSNRSAAETISPIATGIPLPADQRGGSSVAQVSNWKPSGLVLIAEIVLAGFSFLLTSWILYDAATRSELPLAADLFIVLGSRSAFLYLLGPFKSSLRHAGVHELL